MTATSLLAAAVASWPAGVTYLIVGVLVALGSIGLPLPSETALIAGVLLSQRSGASETATGVFLAAVIGGIVGDNTAYFIGRRYGDQLIDWLHQRWPRQFSSDRVGYAKHLFQQRGDWAVFFGRFIALLRMLAGLLAGSLHLAYRRFFVANVAAVVIWAGVITVVTVALGNAARGVLDSLGWVAAIIAIAAAVAAARWVGRSFDRRAERYAKRTRAES